MTYVVNENCIKCKLTDCVEVCPVDCFYEHEHMLVIHADDCIDCGVCEPECPIDAIQAGSTPDADRWAQLNLQLLESSAQIVKRKEPPPDAERWRGVAGKYALVFDAAPAEAPSGE